ncbi:hypothetical protein V1477_008267 [Vespula maculifrons]|uniref:Uncharacterized protein n=1 Tax=Vespula maculifrons TaxID=7453 RepID=A0ABD2CCJ1_VESMC
MSKQGHSCRDPRLFVLEFLLVRKAKLFRKFLRGNIDDAILNSSYGASTRHQRLLYSSLARPLMAPIVSLIFQPPFPQVLLHSKSAVTAAPYHPITTNTTVTAAQLFVLRWLCLQLQPGVSRL